MPGAARAHAGGRHELRVAARRGRPTATASRSAPRPLRETPCASSRPTSCCCTTRSGRRSRRAHRRRARRARRRRPPRLDRRSTPPRCPGPTRSGARCCARWLPPRLRRASTRSCRPSTRSPTAAAPATLPLRSGSTRPSARSTESSAATTSSTRGGCRARRASSSCSRPRRASREPWPLRLIGRGAARWSALRHARARLGHRPSASCFCPFESPTASAWPRAYAQRALRGHARARSRPSASSRFEAAACGARVVACRDGARGARRSASSSHTFEPGDADGAARRDRARAPRPARPARGRRASPAANALGRGLRRRARDLERWSTAMSSLAGRRAARRRARHLRALRADPRLARRPRRRPRDAARHPRADLHPFATAARSSPNWLQDRAAPGDAIAQHGFQHRRTRARARAAPAAALQGGSAAEFAGLAPRPRPPRGRARPPRAHGSPACSRAASSRPAYAYTPALRARPRATRYDWWATLLALRGHRAPAHARARASARQRALKRAVSPLAAARGRGLSRRAAAPRPAPGRLRPPAPRAARSSGSSSAPRDAPRHLRRPRAETPRGASASCARTGARAAPRRDALRVHLPGPAALPPPVVLGLVLPRDRLAPLRPARARAGAAHAAARRPADGFIPHTTFWQAAPRWRRAPLYATSPAATPPRERSRRRCWRSRGSASPRRTTAASRPRRSRARRARALADPRARPRRRRAADDPPARRVRARRLAQVRRASTAARALASPATCGSSQRCRRARLERATIARSYRRARRGRAGQRRSRALAARAAPDVRRARVGASAPTRTEQALLDRCLDAQRGLFFDLAGRAERHVRVSTWSSLAPLALRDPAESASASSTSTSCTRAATARASASRASRWRSRRSSPGFNAYRTWRGAVVDEHDLAAGRRPARARRRATRPTARPASLATRSSAAACASTTTRAPGAATASTGSACRRCCSTSRPGFRSPRQG